MTHDQIRQTAAHGERHFWTTRVAAIAERLRMSFDPGGNLPEDCDEWVSEHEAAIQALEALVKARNT